MIPSGPTSASLPCTSLIIPSVGRPELLLATVRSILEGDEVPTEIIVIDQSDEPNAALAALTTDRPCRINYQRARIAGVSRARNVGIAASSCDILVFTDDDVLVTPTWFGSLVRALLEGGLRMAVTGRVLAGPAQSPDGFAPSTRVDMEPITYAGRIGEDVLYSNNMAFFRSAITEVGPFDERLGAGSPFLNAEDNDLGFRLLEAGYQIRYTPEAVLYHLAWRRKQDALALDWSYAHGQGAYLAKHLGLRDRHMLRRMRRSLEGHTRAFLHSALREHRFDAHHVVYVLGLLTGATKWLVTQRLASPRDATRGRRS